jgi:L-threonylcarbamoyladenylate synthase
VTDAVEEGALAALERGGVLAAATETLFGFLADATRRDAIDRLFTLKPRGHEKGVPLLVPDLDSWRTLVREVPAVARRLADAFWPGPLTIALAAADAVDPRLTLEGSVAVRMPGPSIAAALVRALGRPLTATSANRPGEPPAVDPADVRTTFASELARGDLYLVGTRAPGGAPSTVVSVEGERWRVVRLGAVGLERLEQVVGRPG